MRGKLAALLLLATLPCFAAVSLTYPTVLSSGQTTASVWAATLTVQEKQHTNEQSTWTGRSYCYNGACGPVGPTIELVRPPLPLLCLLVQPPATLQHSCSDVVPSRPGRFPATSSRSRSRTASGPTRRVKTRASPTLVSLWTLCLSAER